MKKKILFVLHEASRTGAPFTQLHMMRWLKENTSCEMMLILLSGGELVEEFEKIASVYIVSKASAPATISRRIINKLVRMYQPESAKLDKAVSDFNPQLIFANTAVALGFAVSLKEKTNIKLVSYLHELDTTFYYLPKDKFAANAAQVDAFIMGSQAVMNFFKQTFSVSPEKAHLIYDFIEGQPQEVATEQDIRAHYGIAPHQKIVGGMATLIWRKGPELFVEVARRVLSHNPDAYFIWVGGKQNSPALLELKRDVRLLGLTERIILAGEQAGIQDFYKAFDVFLLTSREDPFPLVCLEAALAHTPIICFADAGGMPEFVRDDAGSVVPYLDLDGMAVKTNELLLDDSLRLHKAAAARERVIEQHTIEVVGPQIVSLLTQLV